jgi:hypothetical protein
LTQWDAACAGQAFEGPSAGCADLLSSIAAVDPGCASCLGGYFEPSVVPNADSSPCVNTFQTPDCLHALGCFGDCETAACGPACGADCLSEANLSVCESSYRAFESCTLTEYPTQCEDATAFGQYFCGP